MPYPPHVILLYNEVSRDSSPDERDVLDQVYAVKDALQELDNSVTPLPFSTRNFDLLSRLTQSQADFVFNLVESTDHRDDLMYVAPALLEALQMPYTGCSAESMLLTTNKVIAKKILTFHRLPTPGWVTANDFCDCSQDSRYLLKPAKADASIGLTDCQVEAVSTVEVLHEKIKVRECRTQMPWFAERYIEGREINVSLLGAAASPQVLPPAEMKFHNWGNRPKILTYEAKWAKQSLDYQSTQRVFEFDRQDDALVREIAELATKCWHIFGLKGYARVDFRVDEHMRPWILEINANPCISPDSGFVAAAEQSHMSFLEMIAKIIAAL